MSDYLYLYGFVPADAPQPENVAGIDGCAVVLLPMGQLQAVVSYAPAATFAPEIIDTQLQDLKWVGEQGVAHERVVAWFVDQGQILPASLLTLYSSRAALTAAVAEQANKLLSTMERLRGQREWDLKISFDERTLQEHAAEISAKVAELDEQIAAAPAGKGYLLKKKRGDLVKAELRTAAHRRAMSVLDTVRPMTAEARSLPLPRSAESLPVVLHAALLVKLEQEKLLVDELEQQARLLRPIGMEVSFSGPWAPYRFIGDHEQ